MANEELNRELTQLKSDISSLRHDLGSLVEAMKSAGLEQGRQYYSEASERAKRAGESIRARADEAYGMIGREVEEHPFASVLAAFGTGFVVGMLLDRRANHH